jgi:peptide/nickel transport system ATP-binding protein
MDDVLEAVPFEAAPPKPRKPRDTEIVLDVRDLAIEIPVTAGLLRPVRGISFDVRRGETLCIVGESGCGKSLSSLAVMNLLPKEARRSATRMDFLGTDLMRISEWKMADLRGARMSMIFQEPMTSLNPAYTIGNQLEEAWLRHRRGTSRQKARERAVYLLEKVGITGASSRLRQYPHQLSGGLRQRVMIAMALMCGPDLIIADEPTTALDVTIQAQILHLLADLQSEFQTAMLLITHDLGIVARVADKVAVMYAGEFVEEGPCEAVFDRPLHPYTQGLLRCIPIPGETPKGSRLGSIPGVVPNLIGDVSGCMFRNRCAFARETCATVSLDLKSVGGAHGYACVLPPDVADRNMRQEAAAE